MYLTCLLIPNLASLLSYLHTWHTNLHLDLSFFEGFSDESNLEVAGLSHFQIFCAAELKSNCFRQGDFGQELRQAVIVVT